jgi:hypothetical protein
VPYVAHCSCYTCILIKLDLSLHTDFCRGVGEGGGARGSSGNDTSVGEKLLSTLLTEIDGLELAQVPSITLMEVRMR